MKIYYETSTRGLFFQYVAALSSALAVMSFGINIAWTSPYIPYLLSPSSVIPATKDELSWCAVSPTFGCIIGAITAMFLADKIGRKYTTLVMAPLVFLSFICIGFAKVIWYVIGFRMLIGVADGALFTVLPMYLGEIADPNIRGFLSSSIIDFYILGMLFINVIGPFTSIFTSSMICSCIQALHFVIFAFMPESPYYFVKTKQNEKAERSLRMLRGTNNVSKEFEDLQESVRRQESMTEKSRYRDIIMIPSNRKALFIFFIISVTQKMSGKMPVLFYTTTIFLTSGSSINPVLSTILYNTADVIFVTIATAIIIDRFGKKYLLITSAAGCGLFIFLLSFYFFLKDYNYDLIEYFDWLPLTSLVSYTIFYSLGLGFAPIAYLSELFPTSVKAKALCLAEILSSLLSYISAQIFKSVLDYFDTMCVPFFIFAVSSFIGLWFIIKYVPETKGRTLEEIQDYLIKGKWTSV